MVKEVAGTALASLRVLELGHGIAGPFAARLLADLGADVVKVERPLRGDCVRTWAPQAPDSEGQARGALFEYLNWSKRSVGLDLSDPQSRPRLEELIRWADVILVAFRPRRLHAWDLDPVTLRALNPPAVVVAISNFGLDGPFADADGDDLVFQATGGVMQISGTTDREPLKAGLHQTLYCAGLNAAYAALVAHRAARITGEGACVDLAIRECVTSQLVMNQTYYAFMGAVQGRRPPSQDPLNGDPLPCADGYVSLQLSTFTPVERLADLFEDSSLGDPRFASAAARVTAGSEMRAILEEKLRHERGREFFERASKDGLLAGFAQSAAELLDCPQLRSRNVFAQTGLQGRSDSVELPARLFDLSETPIRSPRPAPAVGEHDSDAFPARAASELRRDATLELSAGPLSDLRVLDLSTVFAVPYLGGLLADCGAEVIKVESPRRLDQSRSGFGGAFNNDTRGAYWDRSTVFQVLNRGKRAMCVDLASQGGQHLLRSLVSEVDIVLENFTPRVMRNWGTTFDVLSAINPRLIMLSNTGYGGTGPWSSFKSQGTTLEATMGLSHYSGYVRGKPMKIGQSYPDFLACWAGLTALMAALIHRDQTGLGQHIDLGMYQLGTAVIPEAFLAVQIDGIDLPRSGNRELGALISGVYRAAGDDRWVAISVADRQALERLAAVVPDIAETLALDGGSEGLGVIDVLLADWVRGKAAQDVINAVTGTGVAVGLVADAIDLLDDPQLRHRGFYEHVEFDDGIGSRPLIGRPYRYAGAGGQIAVRGPGPRFAEGNREVLGRLLGMDDATIDSLYHAGVLFDTPIDPPPLEPHPLDRMLADRSFARVDRDYAASLH